MLCAVYRRLPAAYYFASRFADDCETAVLHALKGGRQNMSGAMLTGAPVGAQVGLERIPKRFPDGLDKRQELVALARKLGAQV